jgi:hypothetical protein
VEQQLPEIEAALEILKRLRWAVELSKRGLSEARGPLTGWRKPYRPVLKEGLVEAVLMPEEMVARLTQAELLALRDYWESEVREWGQGIWERRGDTLRLRARRHDYLRQMESLRGDPFGDPSLSNAAAARLVNRLNSEPGKMIDLPNGAGVMHAHSFDDPFGNPLPLEEEQRLLDETLEERCEAPEDDRALRRIFEGTHKKSGGGIHDIDPRLLRSKK